MLSPDTERRAKVVGEGLGPPVAPSFHYLPVELPAVFAVLFEAAKAKFALCGNRVRLSKKRECVFVCSTRSGGSTRGLVPLYTFSSLHFFGVSQRSEE